MSDSEKTHSLPALYKKSECKVKLIFFKRSQEMSDRQLEKCESEGGWEVVVDKKESQ